MKNYRRDDNSVFCFDVSSLYAATSFSSISILSPKCPPLMSTPKPALKTSEYFQRLFWHSFHWKYDMDVFMRTAASSGSGVGRLILEFLQSTQYTSLYEACSRDTQKLISCHSGSHEFVHISGNSTSLSSHITLHECMQSLALVAPASLDIA